jgi:hypothetical protein
LPGDLQESLKNTSIHLHVPGSSTDIPLPIGRQEVWGQLQYAPFKGAYFLPAANYFDETTGRERHGADWPKSHPHPAWYIYPDGTTERIEIPHLPFMEHGSLMFFGSRPGVFIVSHSLERSGKPGTAGGYFAQGQEVEKLSTGYITDAAVSPDGCKVAFVHDPHDTDKGIDRFGRITVKAINLCHGGPHAGQSSAQ